MLPFLCLSLAFAISPIDVSNPQLNHRGWVSDSADLIPDGKELALERQLESLHQDLGVEIAVVTLNSVDRTPKDFATALFNQWGLGNAEANNGLLVLVVLDQRRMEMETGYGLEPVLPDSWLGEMQRATMVPHFKQEDYAQGLVLGMDRIDDRLRAFPEEAREGTRGFTAVQRAQSGDPIIVGAMVLLVGGVLLGLFGVAFWFRRRDRMCPDCNVYMPMLNELQDDEHLDDAQQMEEAIGSIDYQVHACPECDNLRTFTVQKWFSGFSKCPQCASRTRQTHTITLEFATQYSTGLKEISETCANCSYTFTYTRTTPRRAKSSSSGGSSFGGGSFGGGSSGGGGAGSSW